MDSRGGSRPGVGYVRDGQLTVLAPNGLSVPVTVPSGSTSEGGAFGQSYAGERSDWLTSDGTAIVLTLPAGTLR